MTCLTAMEYLCHKWPRICCTCRKNFPVLSSSWLVTVFVTRRLTRRVSLVEQKLPIIPGHLSSLMVLSGIRVTRSLDLCVCFVDRCLSFCTFYVDHCVFVLFRHTDSDCPLWYLQTLEEWPRTRSVSRNHNPVPCSMTYDLSRGLQ